MTSEPKYLACWFIVTLFRSSSNVKLMDQSSRSQEKMLQNGRWDLE